MIDVLCLTNCGPLCDAVGPVPLLAAGLLESPVETTGRWGLVILSVGLFISFVRLMIGPTLADRVVALDMIATLLVGLIALAALVGQQPELLRVATVLALVNFLGTVAFAIYIDREAS